MKQEKNLEQDITFRTYKFTIKGFDSGLNELLNGVHFDYKLKKIVNPVKKKNDDLMIRELRRVPELRGVKLHTPIIINYHIYAKDKRRDRMNIGSAVSKSFCDGLQKAGFIKNDGWDDIVDEVFLFDIDRLNPRIEVTITETEK